MGLLNSSVGSKPETPRLSSIFIPQSHDFLSPDFSMNSTFGPESRNTGSVKEQPHIQIEENASKNKENDEIDAVFNFFSASKTKPEKVPQVSLITDQDNLNESKLN
jgi:predicted SPOUT superfamily RNA methylase MTH1